jgi:acetyltransferase-like isoleucine patch superfamily enzyme
MESLTSSITIDVSTRIAGKLVVESPVRIWPNCVLNQCELGAFSYLAPGCQLHQVNVGRYCSIGDGVSVLSSHPTDGLSSSPFPYQTLFGAPFDAPPEHSYANLAPTTIGHDVWIGSGVKLKAGVRIGNGAVIGAGSVVTKDVADFSLVGGVPARVIRMRFSDHAAQRINGLAWWKYNLLGQGISWHNLDATLDDLEARAAAGSLVLHSAVKHQVWRDGSKILARPIA